MARYIDFVTLGHVMIAVIIIGVAINYVMQVMKGKKLAFIDKMTQIYNRTAFEQKLYVMELAVAVEPTYFLMVDMNHSKYINDTYGHTAGDHAIMTIAKALNKHFVDCEYYRIGGDEFCVIAEGVKEEKHQNP